MSPRRGRQKRTPAKSGHVQIVRVSVRKIFPSSENDKLYRPCLEDDPEIQALAADIKKNGVLEPLVITSDGYILSGHRRYLGACLAGLNSVPCRRLPIAREGNKGFLELLRQYNLQRVKTRDERLREEVISVDPARALEVLVEHRQQRARITGDTIHLRPVKFRAEISEARAPFLEAVQSIIARLEDFWPLSDRLIHYQLLNNPPLIHAAKPSSRYRNDLKSYKALSDLLTRARHEYLIEYDVIADATRPVTIWDAYPDTGSYLRKQFREMLREPLINAGG